MRAISLLCTAVLAVALAAPAGAAPARDERADPVGPYMMLVKKEDRDRGRGQESRREERRGEREGRRERDERHDRGERGRGISRSEAAQRAQRQAPGRVLGVQRQAEDGGYSVNVLDERGRLRVVRVPAEDE